MPVKKDKQDDAELREPAALVPIYGSPDIAKGIQAYRRGDAILYTVRGEPRLVRELMGELDKHGVDEVIALITHPSSRTAEEKEQQTDAEKHLDSDQK